MDVAQLAVTIFIPVLLSLVAYFGHRSIESIDQDLRDLKRDLKDIQKDQKKLDAHLEATKFEAKSCFKDLIKRIEEIRKNTETFKLEVTKTQSAQANTDETQGKILLILNKVVTELKRPQK